MLPNINFYSSGPNQKRGSLVSSRQIRKNENVKNE